MNEKSETYYELLKVGRAAAVSEIIDAYHAARSAFSKESMATYSLFSPEETQEILSRLDEAYHTLANVEKRRQYDRSLDSPGSPPLIEFSAPRSAAPQMSGPTCEFTPLPLEYKGCVRGALLREIRTQRNLDLENVSRTTKIPTRYIKAIENDDPDTLPARVYLQGFVKNLASLYKLDPVLVSKAYLDYIDKRHSKDASK